MRIYLPSTLAVARSVWESARIPPGTGFAVTPATREWYAQSESEEELEYAALHDAGRASLRLLDADPSAPRRRVVFVADVADGEVRVRDDLERGAVEVDFPVPWSAAQAIHVDDGDDEEVVAAVAAAAKCIVEADLGGDDAAFTVDSVEGFELLWFAPQELPDLL
ncbi:hypothetical protein CcI156_06675 [Frankia sp. CcI156]|uniref:DUF6912 family protein n=1 Tax=Frankia TaxID=1854 RepID=UPI0002E3CBF5|nr:MULTISPECIES: hypothetical protein [Frankia]ETA04185.1 hypothetical protein CcI6DRAFT_00400 [Frankia sp. CcI6]EYT93970.1 hypothetical protein ThrDRAFT_00341 [Frankia casuarinae]KDA44595.1 hypothetical protein BMG523Draft_00445 [Frankia sp. BMG5.23]KFB05599.1 hypothetical protein ALLO2DRAFT_01551 [Frankia sp. Allo2]OAA27629.1 hypothetical protein AAY23_102240 [Frankia casuarinae]